MPHKVIRYAVLCLKAFNQYMLIFFAMHSGSVEVSFQISHLYSSS